MNLLEDFYKTEAEEETSFFFFFLALDTDW